MIFIQAQPASVNSAWKAAFLITELKEPLPLYLEIKTADMNVFFSNSSSSVSIFKSATHGVGTLHGNVPTHFEVIARNNCNFTLSQETVSVILSKFKYLFDI